MQESSTAVFPTAQTRQVVNTNTFSKQSPFIKINQLRDSKVIVAVLVGDDLCFLKWNLISMDLLNLQQM